MTTLSLKINDYMHWIKRFIVLRNNSHPALLEEGKKDGRNDYSNP